MVAERGGRFLLALALAATAAWCSSCCTQALYDSVDPNERVWIPADQITPEELARRGVAYERVDWGSDGSVRGYMVEKTAVEKFRDYSLLILGTPVTVTIDGVVIAAYVWLAAGCPGLENIGDHGGGRGGGAPGGRPAGTHTGGAPPRAPGGVAPGR